MKIPLLGRLFKAAPVRNANDAPRSPLGRWDRGNKKHVVEYRNSMAAERALDHPVTFRALHKIASSVQQVDWYCEQDPDLPESERASRTDVKAINNLLKSPNDTLAPDQLRYWMALTLAAYGRVPFKVGVGVSKLANGIYPLNTPFVQGVPDDRGAFKSYRYGNGDDALTLPSRKRATAHEAYIHEIATLNLSAELNSTKNITPLRAIGLPADTIDMLMKRAFDTASGHPNMKYIVTSEKTLTEPQKDAIREHIDNSAPDGDESGGVLFLYNTKVEVHKLDNDLDKIHSKVPLDDMSRMIFGAFGIPISLVGLGAADGAKFAGNYIESRQAFWEDTIIPVYLTPIQTGLTLGICPPGARIRFDLDTIDAIQDSRAARSKSLESVSFLTNDEKREIAGFAPLTAEQRAQLEREAQSRTTAPEGSGGAANGNNVPAT